MEHHSSVWSILTTYTAEILYLTRSTWSGYLLHMEHSDGLPSRVAALIREEMTKVQISQRTLAELSGIPLATLSRRLNGHTAFDLSEIYAIAEHVGFRPSRLVALAEELVAARERAIPA